MMKYVRITGGNIKEYIQRYDVIICSIRSSRTKAKQLAAWEMFFVLRELDGIYITNGPMGEFANQIAFMVHKSHKPLLPDILKSVGYCRSFYILDFNSGVASKSSFNWKGENFVINPLYQQSRETYKEQSSHNREFYIYDEHGEEKRVVGYRGDGSKTGRRALPVEDCRMLVNLTMPYTETTILDPFAGSGGILSAARYINPAVKLISADNDKALEPGLEKLADMHYTVDSENLEIPEYGVDAIVTEVPFAPSITEKVGRILAKLSESINYNGKISLMCDKKQYRYISDILKESDLYPVIEEYVDRQGSNMAVSLWYKQYTAVKELEALAEEIHILT